MTYSQDLTESIHYIIITYILATLKKKMLIKNSQGRSWFVSQLTTKHLLINFMQSQLNVPDNNIWITEMFL